MCARIHHRHPVLHIRTHARTHTYALTPHTNIHGDPCVCVYMCVCVCVCLCCSGLFFSLLDFPPVNLSSCHFSRFSYHFHLFLCFLFLFLSLLYFRSLKLPLSTISSSLALNPFCLFSLIFASLFLLFSSLFLFFPHFHVSSILSYPPLLSLFALLLSLPYVPSVILISIIFSLFSFSLFSF